MIYALKLLAAVSVLSYVAMSLFRPAFKDIFTPAEYRCAWRLVFLGVFASYLCKFPAVFLLVVAGIAIYGAVATGRGPVGKVAVYLLFACTLPPIKLILGGFGGINYLLAVDHLRLVSLVLLTWAALELPGLKATPRTVRFFWIDLLVVAYQVLRFGLSVPSSNLTTLVRTLVESTLDILLPYFLVTRSLRSMADLRFAGGHLLIGLVFAASVGIGETLMQHNLYSGLQAIYEEQWQLTYQLQRGGLLRVQATTPQPIILAFMMLFGFAVAYWLKGSQWRRPTVAAMFGAVFLTMIATFSRGPWLAAGLMVLALVAMQRISAQVFRVILIVLVLGGIGVKLAGADTVVISALGALFGSEQADLSSIEYRHQLLDDSLALIRQSPWFGVPNYAAQMQSLKQGEGIIDIVNSYVAIMLDAGVIGLAIYLLPYAVVLNRLISAIRRRAQGGLEDGSRFALAFIALILGCLFAILTTSSWGVMPMLLTVALSLPTVWLGLSPEERNASGSERANAGDARAGRRLGRAVPIGVRPS